MVTPTHIITHLDKIPRFCAPALITDTAVQSGDWSNPSTWSTNRVPGNDAKVLIPTKITVTYDVQTNTEIDCIEVVGHLTFATDRDTRLTLNNLQVLPMYMHDGKMKPQGELTIGTESNPIDPSATIEIIFRDTPLETGTVENPGRDPFQFSQHIGVFGKVRIHGALKDPFVRTAKEPLQGETSLILEYAPTGWQLGDRLILPDTRQVDPTSTTFVPQWEELIIQSINGSTITLTKPLLFDHKGARDADSTPTVLPDGTAFLPHVGNLTRNILIRSVDVLESSKDHYCWDEDKLNDTNNCITRGHTMVFGRADVDMRYAQFQDLGRTRAAPLDSTTADENGAITYIGTNQIARYAVHTHHLIGPVNPTNTGYQSKIIGNVVDGTSRVKWGYTIHGTHFGRIAKNIAYNTGGSGVAGEDGTEYGNEFVGNFVVREEASLV